ncbi:hypothetical protein [Solilutibacter pythonis]|uniref:hypothetical protein n=1 Tax=Solilutibacter pythonis TaxID=2483112 RepID=UPI0011C3B90A|nr:hypothetical protein [Lysobacter pythonis]
MKSNIFWLMCITIFVGCSMSNGGGIFNKESFVDVKKDERGNVILLDTPRMWRDWQADVDRAVANEVAGSRPRGGMVSWNAQWLRVIDANKGRENASKYITYIIDSRRKAGLPDLEDCR